MNTQMILSLLKRVLAWIGTRFSSKEMEQESDQAKPEAPTESNGEAKEKSLVIIDKPAHPYNYGDRSEEMEISLIVLHYTASGSLDATVRWFQNPEARVSAHYVIGRDGTIVRMVPEAKKAYHAGKSEWQGRKDVNRFSIGIELVNWGKLVKRGDTFFTWPNDYTSPYHGLEPVFLEDAWWEPYPKPQLALSALYSRISYLDIPSRRLSVIGMCRLAERLILGQHYQKVPTS